MKIARKAAYLLLYVASMFVFAEFVGFVGIRVVSGGFKSLNELERMRHARLASSAQASSAAIEDAILPPEDKKIVHPYLGFVYDTDKFTGDSVNSMGYRRDLVRSAGDDKHVVRVGIVGGSVAQSFAVGKYSGSLELANKLSQSGVFDGSPVVEVVNLAIGGFKAPQQVNSFLYSHLLGERMDIIVNIDGVNELSPLSDRDRTAISLVYPRGWYTLLQGFPVEPDVARYYGAVGYLETLRADWAGQFDGALGYSRLAGLVWLLRDDSLLRQSTRFEKLYRDRAPRAQSRMVRGPVELIPEDEHAYEEKLLDVWQESSFTLNAICRAYGIEYFHFLQPNQYVPGSKPMGEEERRQAYVPRSALARAVEKAYPRFGERSVQLTAAGVKFHDLTRIFAEVEEPIYVDTCCHVNTLGNEMIARAIAADIVQSHAK